MAKIYNFNKVKNLRQMNIFYKSVLNVFEYNEQFAILIDPEHICFMPNEEETQKFVRNINLNIASKTIENKSQGNDETPKITYQNIGEEKVEVHALGNQFNCYEITAKDIRIDGTSLVTNKRLIKQFYAKAIKKGKKYEALDFNFEELEPALINDVAVLVLGIQRPTSSQIASIQNYKENYSEIFEDFLNYEENKNKSNKKYEINNALVDAILQMEKCFRELKPLRKAVVLHKSGEGIIKDVQECQEMSYTSFINTSLVEKEENYQNSVFYHLVVPKGTPFVLVNQVQEHDEINNEILLPPSMFEVKTIENDNARRTNIKLKFTKLAEISDIILEAFNENRREYVKSNSNTKKSRDQYEKNRYKYGKFYSNYNEQYDLFDEIEDLIENKKINYVLEEIEDIDYDKELFLAEGDHGISHTKRAMLETAILVNKLGLTNQDSKILLAAAKYHDIGVQNDESDKEHGRRSVEKLNHELDNFSEADKEIIKFIIIEHALDKKENEEDINKLPTAKQKKFKELLSYFRDIDELEKVRLYDMNPNNLENEVSKHLINIAYMNWNLFDTLFAYLLAETFADSRLDDILTHEKIQEQEQEKKKAFALIRIEDKSTLLSKAIKIFDKLRGNQKEENQNEENSAAAAKARLAKVMVGRQIAKEEQEKENLLAGDSTIKNMGNVLQTARNIENLPKENQINGI